MFRLPEKNRRRRQGQGNRISTRMARQNTGFPLPGYFLGCHPTVLLKARLTHCGRERLQSYERLQASNYSKLNERDVETTKVK